jgi:lysophospholipase L1-like esterase
VVKEKKLIDVPDAGGESMGAEVVDGPPWLEFMEMSRAMRLAQFDELRAPARHVLFLGDSITEQGLWSEWFPTLPTLNRGIGGDTIADLAARLESAVNDPLVISLLIGTNDLGGGFPEWEQPLTDPGSIAESFADLVSKIRVQAPQAPLIINSVMPREERFAANIRTLNKKYQDIAEQAQAHYLDLWPTLAIGNAINAEYSPDLLHLNGAGYKAWTTLLAPLLDELTRQ